MEGITTIRKSRMVETIAKVKALIPIDVGPIKIEVEIVNRFIPIVLVDGGSGLNIKPLSTMETLDLQVMNPSPLSLIWHIEVTKF
jgi:hypothetical protein